jgi:rRNA-processing protein FCF1
MSSRHTRRKAAKAKAEAKTLELAKAYRSHLVQETVARNMSQKPERNYYPPSSCMADLAGKSHRAYVCQNDKGLRIKDRSVSPRWKG